MIKVVAGAIVAFVLLAVLRFTGVTLSLESPMFLAELCGLLAIGALIVALIGPEDIRKDEAQGSRQTSPVSASPAARPPRWQNM
jgi:hypothetical protein